MLFTGYAKLLDSQSVDIAEEFVNENKERYEQFKEQKYASGEWQRPKKES